MTSRILLLSLGAGAVFSQAVPPTARLPVTIEGVRIDSKDFDLLYCPWLEGFSDHQSDFFEVVEARR
jgi:hypothetical protein